MSLSWLRGTRAGWAEARKRKSKRPWGPRADRVFSLAPSANFLSPGLLKVFRRSRSHLCNLNASLTPCPTRSPGSDAPPSDFAPLPLTTNPSAHARPKAFFGSGRSLNASKKVCSSQFLTFAAKKRNEIMTPFVGRKRRRKSLGRAARDESGGKSCSGRDERVGKT